MKKIFYAAAVALAFGAASCGKSGDAANDSEFFSQEAADSLGMTFGAAFGANINVQASRDTTVSKEILIKGVQYALAGDTAQSFTIGMQLGNTIRQQIANFEKMGVKIDRSIVLNSFKKSLLDSVPDQAALQELMVQFQSWDDSLRNAKQHFELEKLKNSAEAKENAEKGAKFIQDAKAKNDSVKITASGLGYKIINAGEGEKADPEGRVYLKYSLKNSEGSTINHNDGVRPTFMRNQPEGLKEGVAMLGKGGKAVLYVPGELGYGVEVPGGAPIGLNEMLVYEIEVLGEPAPTNASK